MSNRSRTLKIVLAGIGYFALARLGMLFVEQPEGIAALWPAAGYMLAILVLSERREWPALLAAAGVAVVAANLVEGTSLALSLGFALVNCGESLLAAWCLERLTRAPFSLASPRSTLVFLAVAVLGVPMLAALGGAAIAATGLDAPYWSTWARWSAADGLGMLALAPLLIGVGSPYGPTMGPRRVAAAALALAGLAGVSVVMFSTDAGTTPILLDRPSALLLPLLLLIAACFDNRTLGLAITTVTGTAALFTIEGSGPFASGSTASEQILELQVFLVVAAGAALLTAAIFKEKRLLGEALLTSQERAREAGEGTHHAFVSIDADGFIGEWNAVAERTFGWSREEAIGRSLADTIIPEPFRDMHREGLKRFQSNGEGRVINRLLELSALHRDGHQFPVELMISPERVGGAWRFNAFIRDVSERSAHEQAARNLAAIVESSDDAIMSETLEGEITSWNRGAERIHGYAADEVIGRPVSVLTGPGRIAETNELLARVRRGETVHHHVTERVRKDGRRIQVSLTMSPMRDAGGQVTEAAVIAQDVTDRVQAEAERKRMADELVRSNEELEQFAYVASHDLNEPLRVIGGFVQLLQRRYEGQLDEQADRFIDATVDGIERMQAMIDALLEYSRIGRVRVGGKPVDCDTAVRHARLSLERLIEERHAELRVASLPTITGEPALIDQLFQNLIANAVKYGPPEHPRVEVSAERVNGNWRFSVEDNGAGVDPRHVERVFEMFKRLHAREQAGTGIGLAICKRIVEKHGGQIWVEPRRGGGSAFRFTLPAGPGEP